MNSFAQAGQVIAGRYRLTEPFSEQPPYPGVQAWNVVDTLLGTSLRILALDPGNPNASEVLDAARRSSLIDDPHVVRIISVGEDPAAHYVATEIPLGTPLSAYLHGAPFAPDQAQALTGEVASALNSARARGVRHLQLAPQHVRVGVLGEVFIDGLGVEAALANLRADSMSSSQADRMESRGIAVLLARLLTGDGQSKADAVLRSAAENGSLPGALRSTCTRELRGLGALSPADLVRELAPWGAVEPSEFPSTKTSGKSASPSAEPAAAGDSSDRAPKEADANRGGEPAVGGQGAPDETGSARSDIDPLSDDSVKSGGMKPKWSSLGAFAEEHPEAVDPSATAIFRPEDFGDAPEGDYVSIADGPEDDVSEDKTIETAAAGDKETAEGKKAPQGKKASQGKKKTQGGKKKSPQGKNKASGGAAADAARQAELSQTQVELSQTAVSLQATGPSESLQAANAADPAAEAARTPSKPSGSSADDGAAFVGEEKRKANAESGEATLAGQSAEKQAAGHAAAEANRAKAGKGKGKSSAVKTEEASEMPPSFLPHSGNAAGAATVRMPVSSGGQTSAPGQASPGQAPSQGHAAPASQTASAAQEDPWLLGAQPEEPVSPGNLAGEEIDRPLYNPSKVVVALALVLILVVGAWAVFKFFSPTSVSTTKPTATKSLEPTKAPSSAKKPTESPTKKEDPDKLPEPKVSSVSLLNPYGAQMEPSTVNEQDNPSQIRYLTDRKPSTSWQSWWYGDASYNKNKEGIGLAIKLSGKSKVTSVKIESKLSGGKVEWRNSSESSPNSGDVVAEGGLKPGLTLSASESVATDTVILWFPELSKESAKKYRLDISEITVE